MKVACIGLIRNGSKTSRDFISVACRSFLYIHRRHSVPLRDKISDGMPARVRNRRCRKWPWNKMKLCGMTTCFGRRYKIWNHSYPELNRRFLIKTHSRRNSKGPEILTGNAFLHTPENLYGHIGKCRFCSHNSFMRK